MYFDGISVFRKTGDTMSGQLVINTKEAPLKVQSAELVKNLNANLLEGHDADEFAIKDKNEKITGNWKFAGENEFLKENTFQDTTQFNGTAIFNKNGDDAAIRVGTGDIITDGSLGSSISASGSLGSDPLYLFICSHILQNLSSNPSVAKYSAPSFAYVFILLISVKLSTFLQLHNKHAVIIKFSSKFNSGVLSKNSFNN